MTRSTLIDEELDAERFRPDPEVDELLVGAIDLHVHPGPSPFPRRLSILDAARDADSAGFRAIVIKSHHHSMQPEVLALQDAGLAELNTEVVGGIALNPTVGGLNVYAVELALRMGGRTVWMPTISSVAHLSQRPHGTFPRSGAGIRLMAHEPISILADGTVKSEVHDILRVIAEQNAILNTGHMGVDEIDQLLPAARAAGVERILISHPNFILNADTDKAAEWARQGAVIEHCLGMVMEKTLTVDDVLAYIRATGVGNTVLVSDLGQKNKPLPVTAFRSAVRGLLDAGVPSADITRMVAGNAAQLLY